MCGFLDSPITQPGVETQSMALNKYLNPSLIDFIDHLQSFEYVPEISDVADLIDLHTSTVWKLMKTLKQRGLALQGLVDVTRMGMVEVILIFDRLLKLQEVPKCMLREYSPILPWGSYLRYLVPRGFVESFLNSLYVKLGVEAREVYILPITIHSKPSLREYYDVNSRRFLPEWEQLVTRIKTYTRELLPREAPPEKVRYDEIDLYLVRELEINPFNSVKYITRKLNEELYPSKAVNYILVLRHYNNHVKNRGVIKGVRLKLEDVTLDTPIKTLSVVVGNPIDLLKISRVLTTHPYFLDAYINIPDSVLVTQALVPPGTIFSLSLLLEELKSGGLIKTWRNIYLDRARSAKYAFPVKIHSLTIDEMLNASDEKLLVRKIT